MSRRGLLCCWLAVCLGLSSSAPGFALGTTTAPRSGWTTGRPGPVLALLGSGALVRISMSGITRIARVSDRPISYSSAGPFFAQTSVARFVGVSTTGRIYRLERSGRPRAVFELPRGSTLRGLVAGPASGRLLLISNDKQTDGNSSVVVRVLDPTDQHLIAESTTRSPGASVFSVAIASDEQSTAIAYHGDAEGFDVLDAAFEPTCQTDITDGCFRGHGSVVFAGSWLFSSTGSRSIAERASDGTLGRIDSRLPRNHFLEFAADGAQRLYVAGRCGYAGGLSSVDVITGAVKVLSHSPRICASRVAIAGRWLALAANAAPVPRPASRSRVLFVRRDAPWLRHSVAVDASVIDLLPLG